MSTNASNTEHPYIHCTATKETTTSPTTGQPHRKQHHQNHRA